MNRLDAVTMRDLLPPNFLNDPDAIAASEAVAPDYHRLYSIVPMAVVFANVDNLAEKWLDALAIDMHVDYFDAALPFAKKKELVKQSIPIHRKKGTPWAVEELIRIVFGSGRVEEWWEYGGLPFHFKAQISTPFATEENEKRFLLALGTVKNLRSVLESIVVTLESAGAARAGPAMQDVTIETIEITGNVGDMSLPEVKKFVTGSYFESTSETLAVTA